jgi:hypothetical protein
MMKDDLDGLRSAPAEEILRALLTAHYGLAVTSSFSKDARLFEDSNNVLCVISRDAFKVLMGRFGGTPEPPSEDREVDGQPPVPDDDPDSGSGSWRNNPPMI